MAEIASAHPGEISSYTRTLSPDWLEAGRQWLSSGSWTPDAEQILPQLGVHAGINAVVAAVSGAGDRIVCEHLTYSQVSRSANLMGRQIALVDSDQDGILPEDFERVCEILGIRLKTTPVRLMGGGTRQKPSIWFSGFWSQGDGASFEGYWSHSKGAAARIRDYAPMDATLHGIADRLQALAWWNWSHSTLRTALPDFRSLPVEAFLEKYHG